MNLLIDLLPKRLEVDGKEYAINYDFRTGILFEMMMQDRELSNEEKLKQAIELFFVEEIPRDLEAAIHQIVWFYKCGKEEKSRGSNESHQQKSIYSYNYDDDYIYSAFLSQYHIDLQDVENLHWWKFKAMFKALHQDQEIVKIMGYRVLDLNTIKDKEQKKHYRKLKELYKLPDERTEEEKAQMIIHAFSSLF